MHSNKKRLEENLLLELAQLSNEDVILDIGSGDGYYSFIFSKHAKKVYAIDKAYMDESLMNSLIQEGKEKGISNLEFLAKDVCEGLEIKYFNLAFFSNSFHDINCKKELLSYLYKNSAENGRLLIIEFKPSDSWLFGPPPHIRIKPEDLVKMATEVGFKLDRMIERDSQYIAIFKKEK
jgi:ubiquinone/menaquinone biosynthesis C-methylase UbiE